MTLIRSDIIAALATAPLPAGVAVVRLSGAGAKALADALCPAFADVAPRQMHYGKLRRGKTLVDEGLLVWFAAPNSFTGEEVVEFHGHGGRAVVQAVLAAFYNLGAKPAEAGEFSRRAFINGKLDLTQAEAMADLIAANTEAQRKQALKQMEGELGNRFEQWRTDILHLVAHAEAAIDFPDEDLDILEQAGIRDKIDALLKTFTTAAQSNAGQRLREGFSVAIVGRPNSGKSTLTNLLTGKETSIVSPIAGTTRDVLESHLDVGGYPLILADTAGLRVTEDAIEAEGVSRAEKKARHADLVIVVTEAGQWPDIDEKAAGWLAGKPGFLVVSKADSAEKHLQQTQTTLPQDEAGRKYKVLPLNLTDPESLEPLLAVLKEEVETHLGAAAEGAQLNRERHKQAINEAHAHLERARQTLDTPQAFSADMLAQDLRDSANAIGSVTGRTDTESVLDVVFSTFCVGK